MCTKDIFNFFLKEKIEKTLTLLVFILFLSSFVKSVNPFNFLETPNLYRLVFGVLFTVGSLLFFFTNIFKGSSKSQFSFKKNNKIQFSNLELEMCIGAIQDKIENENSSMAIILPANSSLDDQCINDEKSALGSFVLQRIPNYKELFISELNNYKQKNSTDIFPIGTSFMLNENYSLNYKIIITCVSQLTMQKGVISFPENIPLCIRQIFEIASKNKINHIITPIIGSGHGGITISEALHLIIFSAIYYSKMYHMVKKLTILILGSNEDILTKEFCILNKKVRT